MTMWIMEQYDSWFFRGGEPFIAGEGGFKVSVFPPSPFVMQGAIRTALIKAHGADFDAFAKGQCSVCDTAIDNCEALGVVGKPDDTDSVGLDLRGPYVIYKQNGRYEKLYPVPGDLLKKSDGLVRLEPRDEPVLTESGLILIPYTSEEGVKEINEAWLTEAGFKQYLLGEIPSLSEVFYLSREDKPKEGILQYEPRVKIEMDQTGVAKESMLDATMHVRLNNGFALGVSVHGLETDINETVLMLGGERRIAQLSFVEEREPDVDELAEAIDKDKGFRLIFLQPAYFSESGWLPNGFTPIEQGGITLWKGSLAGIECTLASACIGKPEKIGGYNVASGQVKPMVNLVPKGTVYFCKTDERGKDVLEKLHNTKIGGYTNIGFGHTVIGRWHK